MSLLTNSLKVSQSPAGLNSLLNDNALIFCCVKQQSDENSKQFQGNKETEESLQAPQKVEECPIIIIEEVNKEDKELAEDENIPEEEIDKEIPLELTEENEENDLYIEDLDNLSDCEVNVVAASDFSIPDRSKTAELQVKIGIYSDKPCLTLTIVDAYDFIHDTTPTSVSEEWSLTEVQPVLTYSVHILILPSKKLRFKSKMRKGPNPYFDEVIKIPKKNPETIKSWILRFRLYGSMKSSVKQVVGEGYLFLDLLELEMRSQCKVALLNYDPDSPENVVDTMISASICNYESMMSLDSLDGLDNLPEGEGSPEILIGLTYNSNIGRLTLEVIKGNYFPKSKKNKHPDTFITVGLISPKDMGKINGKTNVKKGTCEPVFEESFVFQIKSDQIEEVSFTIGACFKRRIGKSPTFGAFTLGNENSTEEEESHWKDLKSATSGEQIMRWHKFHSFDKD